jgi:hypothetical protein
MFNTDVVKTDCGAQPASYPMITEGVIPGINRLRREASSSSPATAEVKETWIYKSTPLYIFMA